MARTLSPAGTPSSLATVQSPVTVFDKGLGRYFEVSRVGNALEQSAYAVDASGHEIYRHSEKLAYATGAGANGWTYLIQRGNYLFQAPLSYYSKTRSWGLSPGHELGFNRAITTECIVCHSGRARPVPHRDALYRQPAFSELSIGCENCHGPGELHVQERLSGQALRAGGDASIVNPARLPEWLADNICMFCHQEGDARVLQTGKSYLDFRPGTPLHNTLVIFAVPRAAQPAAQSPLLNHYSMMIASKCYRGSGGRLSCLTCHDPHVQPTAQEAPAFYRAKCLGCHTDQSCALPRKARRRHAPDDDCAGCHMPKQKLAFISHSALTNHRIIRAPGEPYPAGVLDRSTPGLQGLVDLDAVPGQDDSGLPPLTLLLALSRLSERGEPYKSRFTGMLKEIAPQYPDDPVVLDMLARQALVEGTAKSAQQAATDLLRAIQAGSTWAPDYDLLGTLLLRAGQTDQAATVLARGIAIDPYTPSLYPLLAACYERAGQRAEAAATLQEGLRLYPEEAALRDELQKLESTGEQP